MVAPVVPPVADANRYVLYTVNGVSTASVDVAFPVYGDKSDLTVILDGNTLDPALWSLVSASGTPLGSLSQPIADGRISFIPAVTPTVIEIVGSIHPRQMSMPVAPGIGRREFNQVIGYIVSALRELWRKVNLPQQIGFDASGPLAARSTYDLKPQGFRFLRTDDPSARPIVYVKNSAANADWSQGLNLQGPTGIQGIPGTGTVTNVATGYGLSGGPISTSGTLALDATKFGWGFRNRLINGDMRIDQRLVGGVYTLAVPSGNINYTLDRWYAVLGSASTGIFAGQAPILTGGVNKAINIARAAGSSSTPNIFLAQPIESFACIDLQGQNVTFSFKARVGANFSSAGGTINAGIITGTGIDEGANGLVSGTWTGWAVANSQAFVPGASYQTFVVPATIPANATEIGVVFSFAPTGTAGADDRVQITNVQLELGTVTAANVSFEQRPFGLELTLCQRFYAQSWDYGQVSTAGVPGASAAIVQAATNFMCVPIIFPNVMRAVPSVGVLSVSGVAGKMRNYTTAADLNATVSQISTKGAMASVNGVAVAQNNVVGALWVANAEL